MFALLLLILKIVSAHDAKTDDPSAKRWKAFGDTYQKAGKDIFNLQEVLRTLNLIILGKTGSGKSTLINNVFRDNLTKTGIGQYVTEKITCYTKPNYPLTVYDTPGLEIDKDNQTSLINNLSDLIENTTKSHDPNKIIHCIWYCINCNSQRFEVGEIKFIKKLVNDYLNKIPIIIVLTQCYDQDTKDEMLNMIHSLNLGIPVVPVIAQEKTYRILGLKDPIRIQPFGLDHLVDEMADRIPEILKETLNNVQIVSLKQKQKSAKKTIALASTAATAIGGIPFAGKLLAFGTTQIAMLRSIANSYGIPVFGETVSEIINSTIQNGILFSTGNSNDQSFVLPSCVLTAIKMFNNGGIVSAVSSGAITAALGISYMKMAEARYKNEYLSFLSFEESFKENVQKLYKEKLDEFDL